MTQLEVKSNGSQAGDAFVQAYELVTARAAASNKEWTEYLMATLNPSIIHPDDGWVNHDLNEVHPCYPSYFREPVQGDVFVLGTYNKFRVVKYTGFRQSALGGFKYYKFTED